MSLKDLAIIPLINLKCHSRQNDKNPGRNIRRSFSITAITLGLSAASAFAGPAAHADLPPGCSISPPDAHIISGRTIDVEYLFACNNPRIRYVKVTLSIRRDRAGLPDGTVKSYQFDNFRDPRHAGINASLQSDGPCVRGHKYHGDITINVMLSAEEQFTETRRGKSVTCS
jgi:hypothetical protein